MSSLAFVCFTEFWELFLKKLLTMKRSGKEFGAHRKKNGSNRSSNEGDISIFPSRTDPVPTPSGSVPRPDLDKQDEMSNSGHTDPRGGRYRGLPLRYRSQRSLFTRI